MSYQTLYRKYRPQTFEEVIGQEHITKTLANQVKAGEISHAYLFTGSRGTGKTSTARIFAKAINCINPKPSPCHQCEICKILDDAGNIDIIEIDAASNNGVEEIREIREKVKFTPVNSKFKVYIIDEVHMLSPNAFNALLKTLEEPPSHVVFILGTTEVHKLPQTILSRCIRFDFRLISVSKLEKHLKKIFDEEKIKCNADALRALATSGEGSVRDMLSIADAVCSFSSAQEITLLEVEQILGTSDNQSLVDFSKALFSKNIGNCLDTINKVNLEGKNLVIFAKDLSVFFRNLLIIKTCSNSFEILNLTSEVFEKLSQIAKDVETTELIKDMKIFSEIESQLKYAISPRILLETAMLCAISGDEDVKKN